MTVSSADKAAMTRLLQIMNGETPSPSAASVHASPQHVPVELAGAGMVTQQDISAMADVLRRLDHVVNQTSNQIIAESTRDHSLQEALVTESVPEGVKIGIYQIQQHQDPTRVAGQQYFSVVNRSTGDTIANEISLYEAAHALVKLLNQGQFVNSASVRALLESEATYTSQKIDAVRYHRHMRAAERKGDEARAQLMETRKQSSMDKAMQAKMQVRKLYRSL